MKQNQFDVVKFGIYIGIIGIVIMSISALLPDKLIQGIIGIPGFICIVISLFVGFYKYRKSVMKFGWTSEEVTARQAVWIFCLTFFLSLWCSIVSYNVIISLLGAFSAGMAFMAFIIMYSFKNKRKAMAKAFSKEQEKNQS